MKRLFGSKKKKEVVPPLPQEPYDFDKHQNRISTQTDKVNKDLNELEEQIRGYYQKLKKTAIKSEKVYLTTRLKQLLMKRKHLEQQVNRYNNQNMMMDRAKYNKESVEDTIQMTKYMKETNKVQQDAMKNFNQDDLLDALEDMQEMAQENDEIADLMNDQFDMEIDGDIDEELENLENELEVNEMMKTDKTSNIQTQ